MKWRRRPTREAKRAAARAARLKEPKRRWRGRLLSSPFAQLRRPVWRRRLFSGAAWLGGWGLLTAGAAELFGRLAWMVGGGVLLLGLGGLVPLARILSGGLAEYPPWEWTWPGDDEES